MNPLNRCMVEIDYLIGTTTLKIRGWVVQPNPVSPDLRVDHWVCERFRTAEGWVYPFPAWGRVHDAFDEHQKIEGCLILEASRHMLVSPRPIVPVDPMLYEGEDGG